LYGQPGLLLVTIAVSDPRLDNIGRVLTSFDTDSDDGAKALVIQLDGKIVAAGFSGINFQRRWMCNWWTCSKLLRQLGLDITGFQFLMLGYRV
jgi:hypothetical protein